MDGCRNRWVPEPSSSATLHTGSCLREMMAYQPVPAQLTDTKQCQATSRHIVPFRLGIPLFC